MTLWELQLKVEGTYGAFMPDGDLMKKASLCGISPVDVREVFRAAGADPVELQLVKSSGTEVETERQIISDYLVWSWAPIFSERAASLAIELGCEPDEFWACRFQTNPGEAFFFHLPIRSFDVVDVENSTFLMTLPGDPPFSMFIDRLVTKLLPDQLPPCFRVKMPRTRQTFSE
jgi:hypothetical protein